VQFQQLAVEFQVVHILQQLILLFCLFFLFLVLVLVCFDQPPLFFQNFAFLVEFFLLDFKFFLNLFEVNTA